MRVLVACEFSGIVIDAFTELGHDAWSCDLLPTDQLDSTVENFDLPDDYVGPSIRDVLLEWMKFAENRIATSERGSINDKLYESFLEMAGNIIFGAK